MTLASTTRIRLCAFAPGEAAQIAGLWRRAWISAHRDAATVEPIGHWLARVQAEFGPPCSVALLERDEHLLGFMVMHPARHYVAQLFVDTHLQGRGHGQALLDHARRRMPVGWRLHVATANLGAQRFYEKQGLVRGIVDRHPQTGVERVSFHWRPLRAQGD